MNRLALFTRVDLHFWVPLVGASIVILSAHPLAVFSSLLGALLLSGLPRSTDAL
ncbi:hypothetical protein BDV98DRAFT_571324 [Pterulicium gracile]|uniref:Uncharacterized protein n=1 Tax=Pterulicium gracile TaxID=1884261 RepID=A0A5C3QGJ2_9AGAR|nr:hypothetical protein BDV98DRAFT_571324 [Pterula gracilis]